MSVVYEPIEDRVRDSGFADRVMPVVDRQLACRQRGAVAVAIVKDFKQITSRGVAQRRHREVVENYDVRFGKLRKPACVASAAVRDGQLLVKLGHAQIAGGEPLTAGLHREGTTQPAFAEPGRRNENQILAFPNPLTGQQPGGERTVESASGAVVDVLG